MADWQEVYKAALVKRKRIGEIKNGLRHIEEFDDWENVSREELATAIAEANLDADEIAAFIVLLRESVAFDNYELGYGDGLNDNLGRLPDEIKELVGWDNWEYWDIYGQEDDGDDWDND